MAFPPARDSKEVEECIELVIDINPSDLSSEEWPGCCIYRIPKLLRKVKDEAYNPKLVSIGPFHHGKDDLKDTEKHKPKYLDNFLKRTTKSQEDLQKLIKVNEVNIRSCYSEDCGLESDDFVNMILLDAVFIIELFERKIDYIPWLANGIYYDLILLENQLPFLVLEKLYRFAFSDSFSCNNREGGQQIKEHEDLKKEDAPFVRLSRNYFEYYDTDKDKEPKSIIPIGEKVKHFTDLLRYLLCLPNMEQYWHDIMKSPYSSKKQEESSGTRFWQFCPPKMEQQWNDIKEKRRICKGKGWDSSKKTKEDSFGTRFCATKLDDAGLKFKGVKDNRRLLDIQPPMPGVLQCIPCFGRPILEVPQLVIDDHTETLLRNLMALEQCLHPYNTSICNYVFLLDRLIDTEKDVDLLVHKKVIDNQLGSNKIVADVINALCDQITASESFYFNYIGEKLNKHYEYPLNRTMATLKREYFPNVFRGTATVVGLIVLGFTFWSFLRPFVV